MRKHDARDGTFQRLSTRLETDLVLGLELMLWDGAILESEGVVDARRCFMTELGNVAQRLAAANRWVIDKQEPVMFR